MSCKLLILFDVSALTRKRSLVRIQSWRRNPLYNWQYFCRKLQGYRHFLQNTQISRCTSFSSPADTWGSPRTSAPAGHLDRVNDFDSRPLQQPIAFLFGSLPARSPTSGTADVAIAGLSNDGCRSSSFFFGGNFGNCCLDTLLLHRG
jgi:hypothetical protein